MCMEYSKQGYLDTLEMPIQRFYNYIKWKVKLEETKNKLMEEQVKDSKKNKK